MFVRIEKPGSWDEKTVIVQCEECNREREIKWTTARMKKEHLCRSCSISIANTGAKRSEEAKKRMSIAQRKCGNGGIRMNQSGGYKQVIVDGYHPRKKDRKGGNYIMEHILIVEKRLGRFLESREIVHHIDGNKQNNDDSNLFLCSGETKKESRQIHNACHTSAEKLAFDMLKRGMVEFVDGHYQLKEKQ